MQKSPNWASQSTSAFGFAVRYIVKISASLDDFTLNGGLSATCYALAVSGTDLYAGGQDVQIEHWQILSSLGYQRVVKNIKNEGNPYEDWWIDPLVIGEHMWKQFLNEDVEFSEVILKCY